MADRAAEEIWQEALRTAALIDSYLPFFEEIEGRMELGGQMFDRLSREDSDTLVGFVSDAQILVNLIHQLEPQHPAFKQ